LEKLHKVLRISFTAPTNLYDSFVKIKMNNKEIFSKIYNSKIWGNGIEIPLFGSGSRPSNSIIDVNIVKNFISENGINSILDFGHGSFEIWDSRGR